MSSGLVVLKFDSSVLHSPADLPLAVHEVYRWYRGGSRVVVVVSAFGDETDRLLTSARGLAAINRWCIAAGTAPEPHATAQLLATGERASAALMGVVLDRVGIPARVVDPFEIGLTAAGPPLESELVSVAVSRLYQQLRAVPVLVVPGLLRHRAGGPHARDWTWRRGSDGSLLGRRTGGLALPFDQGRRGRV